jgi:rSAM/selenodomain-associated transferase 1
MSKTLLIVFVKNAVLGKVKTRLAKTIGNKRAFEVYQQLLMITENCVKEVEVDKHIYFSDKVDNSQWGNELKFVQKGESLGDRMFNAFKEGFVQGYDKVVLIGSDLPDISPEIIQEGFVALADKELVFGPAEDGGYYLIGMRNPFRFIFENKPWSEPSLLNVTLEELGKQKLSFSLLQTLNDIDTFEDFKSSKLYTDA